MGGDDGSSSLLGRAISGAASDSAPRTEAVGSGGEGAGGAGRRGTAGGGAALGAPAATGGGMSASFTGLPFLIPANIDSRVCREKQSQSEL